MEGRLEEVLVRRSSNRCGRHLHSALSTVPPSLMVCVWMLSGRSGACEEEEDGESLRGELVLFKIELWSSPIRSWCSFRFNVLSCK